MKRIIFTGLMLVTMAPAMAQEAMDDGSMVVLPIKICCGPKRVSRIFRLTWKRTANASIMMY